MLVRDYRGGHVIDARAIVDSSARLGENVSIGPWTIIGADVEIGDGTEVASHVVIKGPTRIGRNNRIFQFSTVGEDTPALAYQGEPTVLEIGDNNTIREGVTIHRGMVQDDSKTAIGSGCLLMAYVHVGHDCILGDHVIMANNASVAGHVHVGDYANFGGYSGVAQYRHIGAHTHVAAMSLVVKDVPDFVTVAGNPAGVAGLNVEGMRRRELTPEVQKAMKSAYRMVYRAGNTTEEALAAMAELRAAHAEVEQFATSIEASRWGIVRPRG